MKSGKAVAVAIATLAMAAIVGSDALARVTARNLPDFAARLPVSNGFAESRSVGLRLSRALQPGPEPRIVMSEARRRQLAARARQAYHSEPLNHDALRNLALLMEADGNLPRARSLMQGSARLTHRDLPTNLWLGRDYARRGQVKSALAAYDRALRTSRQAQDVILPVILDNLRHEALVRPVTALMLKNPPWQKVFWGYALRSRPSLANVARVRMALLRAKVPVDRQDDRVLLAELAGTGNHEAAYALARLLSSGSGGRALVHNAEFEQPADLVPYDWELSQGSHLTVDLSPREGVLRIATFDDGSGMVARQIVSLPGSVYTLEVQAADWDQLDRNALYFRLDCAEKGAGEPSRAVYLDRADFRQGFAKPKPGCTYHWLNVYAAMQPQQANNVVTLDRIALAPGAVRD